MSKTISLPLVFVLTAGLMVSACARGGSGPEARLGRVESGNGKHSRSGSRTGMAAPGSAEQFKASGNDAVYFSSDSTDLTPEAQQALIAQARWLQQYQSQTVSIEGHADRKSVV